MCRNLKLAFTSCSKEGSQHIYFTILESFIGTKQKRLVFFHSCLFVCFHPELIDPKVTKSILQKQQAPGEGESMVNFTETSVINYVFTGLQR
jgi:hypothetical protein